VSDHSATETLNEALAAQRARSNPDAVATITAANEKLDASGAAPGLNVGEHAPDFSLPDATGTPVALAERLSEGPVVLTFYRGEWCPYCNLTLSALQRAIPEIRELGASLIAISPQTPDDALTMRQKHELEFDVLSDSAQQVIGAYRVQFRVPAEIEDVHMNVFKKDISQLNADGSWNLPVPATFVIDQEGVIRQRHVGAEYTQRMEPAEIIDTLRTL